MPAVIPTGNGPPPLPQHPTLPTHPLGQYTDSMYEADHALLQQEIQQRYADILRQLGYVDEAGNVIPGEVEIQAGRSKDELGRNLDLAREQVTQQSQKEGTLFSGYRGTQQARAEHPFVQALADLNIDVPRQLSDLYEHAGGLMTEYQARDSQALALAAQRRAEWLAAHPPTYADPGAGGGGDGTGGDGSGGDGGAGGAGAAGPTRQVPTYGGAVLPDEPGGTPGVVTQPRTVAMPQTGTGHQRVNYGADYGAGAARGTFGLTAPHPVIHAHVLNSLATLAAQKRHYLP